MPGNEAGVITGATRGTGDWLAATAGIQFVSVPAPVEGARIKLALAVGPTEDSWGEGQARVALAEIEQGGPLYSFEEIFGPAT